jgi:hypothetical protein
MGVTDLKYLEEIDLLAIASSHNATAPNLLRR